MAQGIQDFPDDLDPLKVPRDEFKTDILVREIHQLELTIRQLLQSSTQTLGVALVVAGVAATITKDLSRDVALAVLPVLFALVVVYHLNCSAEAAALAELRDRLSVRANWALGTRIFATRLVSDFRRGSRATIGSYVFAGGSLTAALVGGLFNAFSGGSTLLKVLQIVITVAVLIVCSIAILDLPQIRIQVNRGLDEYYGPQTRPETAPNAGGFFSLLRASIFGRPL